jgi:transcriptional regulator with XRE-family HTH domain
MLASNNKRLKNKSTALRRARLEAGLSQLRLSLRAGVSRWRLRLAEEGYCKLRRDELRRIHQVLLLTGNDQPTGR